MIKKLFRPSKWLASSCCIMICIIVTGIVVYQFNSNPVAPNYLQYRDQEFNRLTSIRKNKVATVQNWFDEERSLINKNETLAKLRELFFRTRAIFNKGFDKDGFLLLNNDIEQFFIYDRGSVYDLLFINEKGTVFYSVRLEDDFQTNMIDGPYSNTKLAEIIQSKPKGIAFVDFEYYGASDEPASFFILPVIQNNLHHGCIALQTSINRINNILTNRTGLGRTGEAYLVNENLLMLTQSRFINNDVVLSKNIDTDAVRAQAESAGSMVIDDYRGIKVLSTFQQFKVANTNWRLLVEKDEDEVITEYYRENSEIIYPLLVQLIEQHTKESLIKAEGFEIPEINAKRVDVCELVRTDDRKALTTSGIATCTGVMGYIENGEFAYMAHLSPMDDCYSQSNNGVTNGFVFLRDRMTDIVSQMMRNIQYFDIKPHQIADLRFVIAAPHSNSLKKILEKLINAGVSLSQIKVGMLHTASNVSLSCNMSNKTITGQWNYTDLPPTFTNFESLSNLGDLVIKYEPS